MKKILLVSLMAIFIAGCGGSDLTTTIEGDELVTSGVIDDGVGVIATEDEGDACIVGAWKITNFSEYFEAMVADVSAGGMMGDISSTDSGDLIISFDEEYMRMSDNDFVVTASMMGITVPVDIDANGEAKYEINDNRIVNLGSDVDVSGNAGGGLGYTIDLQTMTARDVEYECEGDSLVWKAGENFAVDITFARM